MHSARSSGVSRGPQLIARAVAPLAMRDVLSRSIRNARCTPWLLTALGVASFVAYRERCGVTLGREPRWRRPAAEAVGRHGIKRSQPISRVLLRRICMRYGRHSSRRRRCRRARATYPRTRRAAVLPNARPPTWCCSGWRLPRFTRRAVTAGDSSLWPCSSPSSTARAATYSGRALPGILLCGARTFLSPRFAPGQRRSGWLRTARIAPPAREVPYDATRQRTVSPARSGTSASLAERVFGRHGPRLRARASPCPRCAAVRRSRRRSGSRNPRAGRARRRPRTLRRRAASASGAE